MPGGAPRLAALLIAHLCPISSIFAPCDPGAAPGIFVTESLIRDTRRPLTRNSVIRVGVLGPGAWARGAHLPGYRRDPRCKVVAIADVEIDRARDAAREFDIPVVAGDPREVIGRDDID